VSCRKFEFTHTREGFGRFDQPLKAPLVKHGRPHILMAMEPSGISWQALDERLKRGGYEGCLGHCQAVRNNRKTMQDGTSHTADKEAYSLFALRRQGQCFLPVERAPAWPAAYRLRQRSRAWKKRVRQRRHQLRAAIPLAFPARQPLMQDLTPPTAWRFLPAPPPPASLLRHGRTHFLAQGQPRQRCGPWRPETFPRI
jgi:transposase